MLSLAEDHHDAPGKGAGGIWFPAPHLNHREEFKHKPVMWRLKWPQHVIDRLVSDDNPDGDILNSDLELAGGLLHLEALAQTEVITLGLTLPYLTAVSGGMTWSENEGLAKG